MEPVLIAFALIDSAQAPQTHLWLQLTNMWLFGASIQTTHRASSARSAVSARREATNGCGSTACGG